MEQVAEMRTGEIAFAAIQRRSGCFDGPNRPEREGHPCCDWCPCAVEFVAMKKVVGHG